MDKSSIRENSAQLVTILLRNSPPPFIWRPNEGVTRDLVRLACRLESAEEVGEVFSVWIVLNFLITASRMYTSFFRFIDLAPNRSEAHLLKGLSPESTDDLFRGSRKSLKSRSPPHGDKSYLLSNSYSSILLPAQTSSRSATTLYDRGVAMLNKKENLR